MHKKIAPKINITTLTTSHLQTPLGAMLAVTSQKHLYLLKFADQSTLDKNLQLLAQRTGLKFIEGNNDLTIQLQQELTNYFNGTLQNFSIPVNLYGTAFENQSWYVLTQIPYGTTTSYSQQAIAVGNPKAFRAVANANKNNPIAIIIPCHRVIKSNGDLCGYNGGLHRKQALLELEKSHKAIKNEELP